MLNTKIFYDNAKYFTEGYYFWAIFGNTYTGENGEYTTTSNPFAATDLIDGNVKFINLAAISAPIGITTTANSTTTYNAFVSADTTTTYLNNGGTTADNTTTLTYTFPPASSGLLVNESTVTSGVGIAGNITVALYWVTKAAAVNLGLLVDENGTVITSGDNFDNAKKKWNYIDSKGAADLFTGISSTVTTKTLAGVAGTRGTAFELIYYTTTTANGSSTEVLNSYNYTGFTVGSLTVTLQANS